MLENKRISQMLTTLQITQSYRQSIEQKKWYRNYFNQLANWYIFPFDLDSGFVNMTNTGISPDTAAVGDYGTFEKVITGNSSLIACWSHSTLLEQVKPTDQFNTKHYTVGECIKGYALNVNGGTSFGKTMEVYATMATNNSYTLLISGEQIKTADRLKFFIVQNDKGYNIGGNLEPKERK